MSMDQDIVGLLRVFQGRVPDPETHSLVLSLALDREQWPFAHEVFHQVRSRTLAAISAKDKVRECQYSFEEICLKSLYNETSAVDPFDHDSPHWITKNAIDLARSIDLPVQAILDVIAPQA